jgi:hypothetical protein
MSASRRHEDRRCPYEELKIESGLTVTVLFIGVIRVQSKHTPYICRSPLLCASRTGVVPPLPRGSRGVAWPLRVAAGPGLIFQQNCGGKEQEDCIIMCGIKTVVY